MYAYRLHFILILYALCSEKVSFSVDPTFIEFVFEKNKSHGKELLHDQEHGGVRYFEEAFASFSDFFDDAVYVIAIKPNEIECYGLGESTQHLRFAKFHFIYMLPSYEIIFSTIIIVKL